MVKIGIMQPYLFPYIGYFQLINAVDKFVIHDDVQFIKGGWINRNKIILEGKEYLFTFSVKRDSSQKNINLRIFSDKFELQKSKFLRILKQAYKKAPHFDETFTLINEILSFQDPNVSNMIVNSLTKICQYLSITTPLILSSALSKNNLLKGEERVININQNLGATHYINPIGGSELYSKINFSLQKIKLTYLKPREISYKQFENGFVSWLSIIDLCMFNTNKKNQTFLKAYDLI